MSKLNVAFYWHMHQPYYKDSYEEKYILPWVRLHCIKAYYDMPLLLEDCPGMKLTFNIVPSLARQIRDYTIKGARDIYFDLSMKDPTELSDEEKVFILKNFFMCHWGNMIHPYKRYSALLRKRGVSDITDEELRLKSKAFSRQEILDLQVWFNLSWFGFYAARKYPFIRELKQRGRNFSADEKERVLSTHITIMEEVLELYKRFQDEGSAELTTSPYYHPILPLVYDNRLALRCMPQLPLNNVFSCQEDARSQIVDAVRYHEKVFGKPPKGMWPSEGSVAPELVPLLQEAGIEWIATDQDILSKSLNTSSPNDLFQAYTTSQGDASVKILFRDRGLSDLIGFTYAKNNPQDAVKDFIKHLHSIRTEALTSHENPAVFIILDGENAWEHYSDGGEEFLSSLYRSIVQDPLLEAVTVNEYLTNNKVGLRNIENLYTGSWIFHDFQIWIGSEEDRKGWDYLRRTRKFFEEYTGRNCVPEELKEKIMKFIHRAEGSDWFWWYGDEFSSENKQEFDLLFRKNLMMVYTLLGQNVPDFLRFPIVKKETHIRVIPPVQMIDPVIDGEITNYFEWFGAGSCETVNAMGAMHQKKKLFKTFEYGYNDRCVFLKLEYEEDFKEVIFAELEQELKLKITINNSHTHVIEAPLLKSRKETIRMKKNNELVEVGVIATGTVTEVALSFEQLDIAKNELIHFSIELWNGKLMLCQFPTLDRISIQIPDEHYNQKMWVV